MKNKCNIEGCSNEALKTGMCGMHYQRQWKHGDPLYRRPRYDICTAAGCIDKVRSAGCPYCEMHYGRLRRNGTLEKVNVPHVQIHSQGYILVPSVQHPLVQKHAGCMEYEHRIIYYDVHGKGPFECYWCGEEVDWGTLHIDHLNESKKDNSPDNLVASCPVCNLKRGRHRMVIKMREKYATWIEFNGQRRTAAEWAETIGISRGALKQRIKSGWPLERALAELRSATGPMSSRKPYAILNAAMPMQMLPFAQNADAL